jgi:FKBP-type peptidyl-prolyl cis-trans isomerase SlyD
LVDIHRGRIVAAALCHDGSMIIEAPCVVALTWLLSDGQNRPIDELKDPVEFFYGGDDLLAPVEEALAGNEAGADVNVHLEPEQAFGDYQPELVCFEARSLFPAELEVGMAFEGLPAGAVTPDMPADAIYLVTEIYPSHVVLDANHPLAGMALRIQMRVVSVRPASDEEAEARSLGASPLALAGGARRPPREPLH